MKKVFQRKKEIRAEVPSTARPKKSRRPMNTPTFLVLYLLGLTLILTLFFYWQRDAFFPSPEEDPIRVSVILPDNDSYAISFFREGMNQAAFDWNVELTVSSPLQVGNSSEQLELLEREELDLPQGLVVFPVNTADVVGYLAEHPMDTKILLMNATQDSAPPYSVIGANYQKLAEMIFERIQLDHPQAKNFALYYTEGQDTATRTLETRLIDLLKEKGFVYERHSISDTISVTRLAAIVHDTGEEVSIGLDGNALEMLADSLNQIDPSVRPAIYGRGESRQSVEYVKSERITTLYAESHYNTGYIAISEIAQAIANNRPIASRELSFTAVDADNVTSREIELLLFPIIG